MNKNVLLAYTSLSLLVAGCAPRKEVASVVRVTGSAAVYLFTAHLETEVDKLLKGAVAELKADAKSMARRIGDAADTSAEAAQRTLFARVEATTSAFLADSSKKLEGLLENLETRAETEFLASVERAEQLVRASLYASGASRWESEAIAIELAVTASRDAKIQNAVVASLQNLRDKFHVAQQMATQRRDDCVTVAPDPDAILRCQAEFTGSVQATFRDLRHAADLEVLAVSERAGSELLSDRRDLESDAKKRVDAWLISENARLDEKVAACRAHAHDNAVAMLGQLRGELVTSQRDLLTRLSEQMRVAFESRLKTSLDPDQIDAMIDELLTKFAASLTQKAKATVKKVLNEVVDSIADKIEGKGAEEPATAGE